MNKTFTVKKTFIEQGEIYIIPIKEFDNEEEAEKFCDSLYSDNTWDDVQYYVDEE